MSSWLVDYEAKLYRCACADSQGTAAALDLANLFVRDLNRTFLREFTLACKPDEQRRRDKAPDFLYKDSASELCVVFEVTRALDERATQRNEFREDFLAQVRSELDPGVDGEFVFFFQQAWPSSKLGRKEVAGLCGQVAARIAPWVKVARQHASGEHRLDLSPLLPAVVRRFDWGVPRLRLAAVPPDCNVKALDQYLLPVLYEANCKLRTYHDRGCETFLLLDCRLMEALNVDSWDRMDCTAFAHVQHVMAFDLSDSGVGVVPLWQVDGVQLALPVPGSAWAIEPPGYYRD